MFKKITSLGEAIEESSHYPVLLYKHSSTCPRSARAQREVESYLSAYSEDAYSVVVQDERSLSNEIAEKLNIKHETPQLIVLRADKPPFVLNHENITRPNIETVLQ